MIRRRSQQGSKSLLFSEPLSSRVCDEHSEESIKVTQDQDVLYSKSVSM